MRKKSVGQLIDNNKSSTSTAYQRGNNRDGSPHYVFLYSDDDDNDNDDDDDGDNDNNDDKNSYLEQIPLQSRKAKSGANIYPRKVEVITVTLKPDDTLQALSLRYRCSISELKRINNIHKENEIFARRILKVPVQPFSIFTEMTENNQENKFAKSTINLLDDSFVDDEINNGEQNNTLNISSSSANNNSDNNVNNDINNIILNSLLIEPLRNDIVNDNFEVMNTENDELLLINERVRDSTPEARVVDLFGCSGADWGLTWVHLLIALLLFGFVLPAVFIIIMTEHQHENHHTNTTNSTQ
ncbi:hypothetical protein PV328_011361 [Microctonus aethiopoides]|uniref:LysM domain-containing protein n=1 Tax=Microctonus aethiopoides TaxID=144406 RepID=A0AA39EXW9_9HYME|nr:hypothetical protein PV328_011361 [Microctonus aethiopoides]